VYCTANNFVKRNIQQDFYKSEIMGLFTETSIFKVTFEKAEKKVYLQKPPFLREFYKKPGKENKRYSLETLKKPGKEI
jgi:hypothetical protein